MPVHTQYIAPGSMVPETQGGTGERTPSDVLKKYNGVPKSYISKLVTTDHRGLIPTNDLPYKLSAFRPTINGPLDVQSGKSFQYEITNYNSFSNYTCSYTHGVATLVDGIIKVSPDLYYTDQNTVLTINDRDIDISLTGEDLILNIIAIGAGGGGGGGNDICGGGGGGGGAVVTTQFSLRNPSGTEVYIYIGQGGVGGTYNTVGASGGDTMITGALTVLASGGNPGDAGGGTSGAGTGAGGAATSEDAGDYSYGGTGTADSALAGGPGIYVDVFDIHAASGGGGGGLYAAGEAGSSTAGKGGIGIQWTGSTDGDAQPNTGSGGGGGGAGTGGNGGAGGSGRAVFYYTSTRQLFTGGLMVRKGSTYYHHFTENGVLTYTDI